MENIGNLEVIERMEALTPSLLRMRQEIDDALVLIKSFRASGGTSTNRIRREIILHTVTNYYGLTIKDISSRSREGDIRKARQIYCALTKKHTEFSFREIGEKIDRDHSTVMHSCKVIEDAEFSGDALYKQFNDLDNVVKKAFIKV